MISLTILSDQSRFSRGFHDFFPFYKWSSQLLHDDIKTTVVSHHLALLDNSSDILILSSRYFQSFNRVDIPGIIEKLRINNTIIVWYDAVDTSGSVDFDIIEYVDVFLKKQILRNKNIYLENRLDQSVRVWLQERQVVKYPNYTPCKAEQLHKIKVGWNIGLCDYRYFPGYSGLARNFFFWNPSKTPPSKLRRFDTIFRGSSNYTDPQIAFQRNCLVENLTTIKADGKVISEGKVPYKKYLQELQQAKISVSPFGWGEICYRDFESVLSGCVLMKPDMAHIETFPNIYTPESYISVRWDMSDFQQQFEITLNRYDDLIEMAQVAQDNYCNHVHNSESFIKHLKNSLSI